MLSINSLNNLTDLIKEEEGYRQFPYLDTQRIWTIGYGRNMESAGFTKNSEIFDLFRNGCTKDTALYWLSLDIQQSIKSLEKILSFFYSLDDIRKCVLIDMNFNMGIVKMLQFKNTLSYIEAGQYLLAATEMLNSKWAKQVGTRALELSEMMKTGEWQ